MQCKDTGTAVHEGSREHRFTMGISIIVPSLYIFIYIISELCIHNSDIIYIYKYIHICESRDYLDIHERRL